MYKSSFITSWHLVISLYVSLHYTNLNPPLLRYPPSIYVHHNPCDVTWPLWYWTATYTLFMTAFIILLLYFYDRTCSISGILHDYCDTGVLLLRYLTCWNYLYNLHVPLSIWEVALPAIMFDLWVYIPFSNFYSSTCITWASHHRTCRCTLFKYWSISKVFIKKCPSGILWKWETEIPLKKKMIISTSFKGEKFARFWGRSKFVRFS